MGAIVIAGDSILLVTRTNPPARGLWTIPGGRIEPGERMAEAVVREVLEETGLAVDCGPLVGWVERFGPDFHFVIFDFRATPIVTDGPVEPDRLPLTAGDDAGVAQWVPLAGLDARPLVPGLLDFLDDHGIR